MDTFSEDRMTAPAEAKPKQVRRKRAPKHDFKDGNGRVFAHRHDHGGGWVADTAYVAASVEVTRNAQVYDYARVYDNCRIQGAARVHGRARLFGNVNVRQNALVRDFVILRDSVTVGGRSALYGHANVSGTSTLTGRVEVSENAVVHSTQLRGPLYNGQLCVMSAAKIYDSSLSDATLIRGAAYVTGSTAVNIEISGNARIINSYMLGHLTTELNHWLRYNNSSNTTTPDPPIHNVRPVIQCLSVGSHYVGGYVVLRDNLVLLNTALHLSVADAAVGQQLLDNLQEPVLRNVNVHSLYQWREQLDRRNTQPVTAGVASSGMPLPIAELPDPHTIRGRRLLRLEGEPS